MPRFAKKIFGSDHPEEVIQKVDDTDSLINANAPMFKTYLEWRLEESNMKVQSSIKTVWKLISMNFMVHAGQYVDSRVLLDMRNVSFDRFSWYVSFDN